MLDDMRAVGAVDRLTADVCIVGAGPAGITVALELAGAGYSVLVLEAGGRDPVDAHQHPLRGERSGEPYPPLDRARVRAFGGSSRHWPPQAMMARPLEPIDLRGRPGLPYSGWPVSASDLAPYYRRAVRRCELRVDGYDLPDWAPSGMGRLALSEEVVRTSVIPSAPPDVFDRAAADLRAAPNVTVMLHAPVTRIETARDPGTVSGLVVAAGPTRAVEVVAQDYVLATGGIDNARMLLVGNEEHPEGIGNHHGNVGRFFMEHLSMPSGILVPDDPELSSRSSVYEMTTSDRGRWRAILTLHPRVLEREGLLNGAFFLEPRDRLHSSPGWLSLEALRRVVRHRPVPPDIPAHVRTVARYARTILAAGSARVLRRPRSPAAFVVRSMSEQEPNRESRVLLGDARDALGVPVPHLRWRTTARDVGSVRRAQQLLGDEVARAGAGTLHPILDDPAPVVSGSWHHLGTTRMDPDPRRGVTDVDARVHGLRNLFVAGSSLFPTGGYANPTLTIVALAIRLADHLGGRDR